MATGAYLALRVLYTGLYINTSQIKYSYLRSVVWVASTAVLLGLSIKAGNKVAFA